MSDEAEAVLHALRGEYQCWMCLTWDSTPSQAFRFGVVKNRDGRVISHMVADEELEAALADDQFEVELYEICCESCWDQNNNDRLLCERKLPKQHEARRQGRTRATRRTAV